MGAAIPQERVTDSTEQGSTQAIRSLLIVDCGSVFTKVALLGRVDGRFRMLARAQSLTTNMPPITDVLVGVRHALSEIERTTGCTLQRDQHIILPMREDGTGVDGVALVMSAGGPLHLLTTGPGRDHLAALVLRSLGGLFISVEALPVLSARPQPPSMDTAFSQARLRQPHALLVVGQPFGEVRPSVTLEEATTAISDWIARLNDTGLAAGQRTPVVFTGSAREAERLAPPLRDRVAMQVVEGLSPSTLTPLNRAVSALYEPVVLSTLPGFAALRQVASAPPIATITALAGMVRFLAQRFETNVVGVDVGASSTALAGSTAQGEFLPALHPSAGVGPGIGTLLRARGAAGAMQWLAILATEDELREYALMRMLRPTMLPLTTRELEFEYAFAREAIQLALRAPGARLAGMHPMDVVLGTGGVLANVPHPAHAALLLLDALQPRGITALMLDTAQLASMIGSGAALDAVRIGEAAISDAIGTQLATVISPVGEVAQGEPVVRVTLEFASGHQHEEEVHAGAIARLPLPVGEQAILGLYPAPGVDIGLGPGQHAHGSEPVEGGPLGLVVDARGRPLRFPQDREARAMRLLEWRRTLGLEG
ncbi:MAG: hypothetical protein OJF49_000380 [Ktedonobacterales bacterium]|nr:MAG: hypothetical protein OJF49_000380 [Ktedonobacterales bacterium]